MNYPQLSGEPNFVLIGVSAVFGLFVIIMVYYIFVSKTTKLSRTTYKKDLRQMPTSQHDATLVGVMPKPVDSSGYYAPAPTGVSSPSVSNVKQVYNIKNNIYTLDDAPAVCGVFGGEVATIDQLIAAHKNGADWCSVGWTKDGLAAYPIQYSTWKTLQENEPNKRNICGTPGINLVRNDPNLLYGVNCYGVKPEPKGSEKIKQSIISDKQLAINAKIAELQKNMNSIGVLPFNQEKWSL